MFEDPTIDLTTRPILEQMRKMTICRQTAAAVNGNSSKADSECGDFLPFLNFPNEIIRRIFMFFDFKSRLRLGLNRRLRSILLETKLYVDNLLIEEMSSTNMHVKSIWGGKCQRILISEDNIACLRTIAVNTSIRRLSVQLAGSDAFHCDVANFIKNFELDFLYLRFEDDLLGERVLVDSYLLDLAKKCKSLIVRRIDNVTPEALHRLYKMMMDGSAKLRELDVILKINGATCTRFVELLGISFRRGLVYSRRREIEVFSNEHSAYYLFDGLFEVFVDIRYYESFHLKLHDNRDSIEKSKKNNRGFQRIQVIAE